MSDVLDAAYRVGHDFRPDGAVGLARRMGVPAGTFLNELNPELETHKLGLGRAVAMTLAAGDFRILKAFAFSCDHVVFPFPNLNAVGDAALLDLFLSSTARAGNFAEMVRMALADGAISAAEFADIEAAAHEAVAAVLEVVARLEGLRDG